MVACPQAAVKVTPCGAPSDAERRIFLASRYFAVAKEHGALAPLKRIIPCCPVSASIIFASLCAIKHRYTFRYT